jgi:hypothetical protein
MSCVSETNTHSNRSTGVFNTVYSLHFEAIAVMPSAIEYGVVGSMAMVVMCSASSNLSVQQSARQSLNVCPTMSNSVSFVTDHAPLCTAARVSLDGFVLGCLTSMFETCK